MYKFALNINDNKQQLSPKDGLEFGDLGVLIKHLDNAINPQEPAKCTLYDIQNHGYTPHFITSSKNLYTNFIELHQNIYEKSVNDLRREEATYANSLKRILGKDKYVEPLDNDSKPLFRITSEEIEKGVDTYNNITNIAGIVSEIGSQKLDDTSHVYLHGVEYKIYITVQQDAFLKKYYKGAMLDFKIKQRKSIKSGRVVNAHLISIKIKSELTIGESMATLNEDDLSFLKDISSYEDILTLIRS